MTTLEMRNACKRHLPCVDPDGSNFDMFFADEGGEKS